MIRQNGGVGSEVGGVCCVGESVHHCLPKREVSVGWFVLADQRGVFDMFLVSCSDMIAFYV